ncbi:MAG: sulfatase/phosphatase domain-containing protein, partial [Phycisphaerales bacterium]
TYVFFSADHGAQGGGGGGGGGRNARAANPPFVGAKGSVSEGGIRVPFIITGPGIAKGAISRVRATGMDIVPTLRDLAGAPIPKAEDPDARDAVEGGSMAPVLKASGPDAAKATVARAREEIVIHFPHYDLNNGGPASAIYLGDHKLVRNYDTKKVTLYDIAKDPGESNDLAAQLPERVKELEARLDAYLKAIKAQMPTVRAEGEGSKPADAPADSAAPKEPRQPKDPNNRRQGGGGGGRNRGERPAQPTQPTQPSSSSDIR